MRKTHESLKRKLRNIAVCIIILFPGIFTQCEKTEINPNIPDVYINITLDPNSTVYQELNTAGGWMYLTSLAPSRGIIVYRLTNDEFLAFDRIPPNEPDKCCVSTTNCTRLIVGDNYPFAKDECLGTMYSLLDGSIFSGEGKWGMIRYNTVYNGVNLRIFN